MFARQSHAEAIARISFCVVESALCVVTGDVGAGKTVALSAAVAALDYTRHQVIYVSNQAFGTRGLYVTIVRALGAQPPTSKPSSWPTPSTCSPPRPPNGTAASSSSWTSLISCSRTSSRNCGC